jgi:hypothetical protein
VKNEFFEDFLHNKKNNFYTIYVLHILNLRILEDFFIYACGNSGIKRNLKERKFVLDCWGWPLGPPGEQEQVPGDCGGIPSDGNSKEIK